jgi:hypothetical protein
MICCGTLVLNASCFVYLQENPRLYLQLIDMGLQQNPLNEDNIISIIDQFLCRDTDPEQKVLFAQRKVEFLEDFGSDILRYLCMFFFLFFNIGKLK